MLNTFFPALIFSLAFGRFIFFIFRSANHDSHRFIIRLFAAIGSFAFGLFLGLFVFTASIAIMTNTPFEVLQDTLTFNDYPGSMFFKSGSIGALLGAGYAIFGKWPATSDQAQASKKKVESTSMLLDSSESELLSAKPIRTIPLFKKFKLSVIFLILAWVVLYFSSSGVLVSSSVQPVEKGSFAYFFSKKEGREVPKKLVCTYFIATGFLKKSYSYAALGGGKVACPRIFSFADTRA